MMLKYQLFNVDGVIQLMVMVFPAECGNSVETIEEPMSW